MPTNRIRDRPNDNLKKEIAKNYDYTKTDLSKAVNDLIKKRNSKVKNKKESISLIDRQEKAIATNFDIHYNEISLNWEIKEYETNKEVTDYDIIRKLRKQHISINENDLKIILKSNFLINLDELESLYRAEKKKKLKSVFSKDFIKVRIQYDILKTYYSPADSKDNDGFYTTTDLLNAIINKTNKNIKINSKTKEKKKKE